MFPAVDGRHFTSEAGSGVGKGLGSCPDVVKHTGCSVSLLWRENPAQKLTPLGVVNSYCLSARDTHCTGS